jgi:choloylglycine hydrolase
MDWSEDFGLRPCITPRGFAHSFRFLPRQKQSFAMIGMARVEDGIPLYAEAINEKGVAMAGLNFPVNAVYETEKKRGRQNVCVYELTPWLLGRAESLAHAGVLLEELSLLDFPLREDLPNARLHWMVSDASGSLVLESRQDGIHVFSNPVNVLTNNPPFEHQLSHLSLFSNLAPYDRENCLDRAIPNSARGLGTGGFGLPGDYSSSSRFVKSAWLVSESPMEEMEGEEARIAHVFSLLSAVAPPRGSVQNRDGDDHQTVYSVVANAGSGDFYLRRYDSLHIENYHLSEHLEGNDLILL